MNKKKVIMIGLRSSSVDYEKWPELSPEKLESAFAAVESELTESGYEASWCLTDTGETAESQVTEALREHRPDIVLIGAGVRTDPDHLYLFEKILNIILKESPQAKVTFNTQPFDSVEAVRRWSGDGSSSAV